ncbi:hypothetical protein OVA24_06410 [Luteolibacter sp. SL250]|uniref:hypothetical protein n=1 Tax=Luteolibacter sp. SL250 TaxID=2995170 RepID=UPI00227173F8|nr:hypothetical protein [Luteolibacter sp. SL250]WAC21014.1 hypothetical protein OVA24_06410 [Luteolibacter sp. SL250]
MDPVTTSDFWNKEVTTVTNGTLNAIVLATPWDAAPTPGIGSLWEPTVAEKAAIAAGQPVLLWFPGLTEHPSVFIQALEDPVDDATLAIPPESGLARVQLVGGTFDGSWVPASTNGLAMVWRGSGSLADQASYDAYGHIPGDPANQVRHLAEYLAAEIPGADYTEKVDNLETERNEVNAWRLANLAALQEGILPPQVTDLDTPIDRVQANLILIRFPDVPQPSTFVPGP